MRNNKIRIIITAISIVSTMNVMFSQCPVTFPKSIDVCLEGISPGNDICFQNSEGNLNFLFNSKKLFSFSKEGNFNIANNENGKYTKLIISGPNQTNDPANPNPNNYRDISYEFLAAGSAKIRSFRGNSMDTYLQFLTNLEHPTLENPQVRMHINHDGKVGIGTTTPQELLDVNGNLKMGDVNSDKNELIITGKQTPNSSVSSPISYRDITYTFADSGTSKIRSFRGDYMDTYLQFLTNFKTSDPDNPQIRMHINHDGKIGIGTVTLMALLDVRGNVLISDSNNLPSENLPSGYRLYVTEGILSEKFKAAIKTSAQWSDYVFDKDYKLKPLEEVEQYILANKHLPNIPSAEEIIKDGGIDLAQMQAKQMEKIEELTLYMIEMKKEIETLKKQNKELKEKFKNN